MKERIRSCYPRGKFDEPKALARDMCMCTFLREDRARASTFIGGVNRFLPPRMLICMRSPGCARALLSKEDSKDYGTVIRSLAVLG